MFLGPFFGDVWDSEALGRFVFFLFLKFGDSWNFGKKTQDFLNLPKVVAMGSLVRILGIHKIHPQDETRPGFWYGTMVILLKAEKFG